MYVAREGFFTVVDGKEVVVVGGVTRVRDGHPLLNGREHLFEIATAHYETEHTPWGGETRADIAQAVAEAEAEVEDEAPAEPAPDPSGLSLKTSGAKLA